ncbi:MAG: reverse transcriptase domain-containing protein, partial [Eubacterium aggregans]
MVMPPGRPIVSDCGSETYATAEYVEHFLNPISTRHPSYIKDTYDFIEKIKNITLPTNCLLFTIDIESLYTNIETPAGLEAVREWFTRYPDKNRPEEALLKLLEINLTKNDFEFNSNYYLQIKGTAMGKRFAPSYANIFMARWEEAALDAWHIKPLHYYRFLDDIWGVWSGTKDQFEQFADHLNRFHRSIRIKHTLHGTEVNFLDTVTYKGKDFPRTHRLDIKVYFKDTDTHALLYKSSYHPKHTFRGIVKSQLQRFHRICTQPNGFQEAKTILFQALRKRGYSRSFLRNCLKGYLRKKEEDNRKIIPLITTFSKGSVLLNGMIKNNFNMFLMNAQILDNHKVISAYRRNKNLKDILVRSR